MTSQHQRSDLVDDLALFVGRPIAEVGEPLAVGHGAGSGSGMTVVVELAHNQEPERLSYTASFASLSLSPSRLRGRLFCKLFNK